MIDLNTPIDCPKFNTLHQLKDGFGSTNPELDGKSCTGCKNMVLMGGLLTCKYLHQLMDNGDFLGDIEGGI